MALPDLQWTDEMRANWGTVLSYGPAGAGKTRSIKTLKDEGFNPIVLSTEPGETAGFLTLKAERIPILKITAHTQLLEVLKELKSVPGKVRWKMKDGKELFFDAVVLDSLTQWGEMPLDAFCKMKGWADLQTPQDRKDPRQAYGYLAEKGRQLYKDLFELSSHLYVVAREGLFGGEGDVGLFGAPELPGQKLPREVPGWPDATVRLRVIPGSGFRMLTQGEGGSPARVRYPENMPKLPGRCLPNIGALIKFMCGDASAHARLVPQDPKAPAAAAASPVTPSVKP